MRDLILFCLLMLCFAGNAFAQTTYTLAPNPAREGDSITLRIDDVLGCFPAAQFDVSIQGSTVSVLARMTDAGPCLPDYATPRLVPITGLSAGVYQVQVSRCGNAPPPAPECVLDATLSLTVSGASGPHVVPALSDAGFATLILSVLALGVVSARLRLRA